MRMKEYGLEEYLIPKQAENGGGRPRLRQTNRMVHDLRLLGAGTGE